MQDKSENTFERIKTWLDGKNIAFTTLHHPPTYTSEDSAKYRGESLSVGAKAIVYKIESSFYLFVMPANRKMDTKKVKTFFKGQGRKAKKTRFASAEELKVLTSLVPGSVPPFGDPILPFELFVDSAILENKKVAFNAGSLTDSIIMSREDYIQVSKGHLLDFTIEIQKE